VKLSQTVTTVAELKRFVQMLEAQQVPDTAEVRAMIRIGGKVKSLEVRTEGER
jgi:hypothetical protein